MHIQFKFQVDFTTRFTVRVNIIARLLDNQAIITDDLAIYCLTTSCINQVSDRQNRGKTVDWLQHVTDEQYGRECQINNGSLKVKGFKP